MPEGGVFGQRYGLKRAFFSAVEDSAGSVDVNAADGDHATGYALENLHEGFGLRSGAEDQVDHDVRGEV